MYISVNDLGCILCIYFQLLFNSYSMHLYLSSYRLGNKTEMLKEWFAANPVVGYIPNACDFSKADPIKKKEHDDWNLEALKELGLTVKVLDLREYFGKKEELRSILQSLGGVWISGGNVFVLLQAMKLSAFDDLLINEFSKKSDFVYAGYSAAGCVLSPDMRCYSIVDDATDHPYAGWSETIWDGLGLIDFAFMPHFDSDHSESADINKEVAYCEQHQIPYKTLRDGEVMIL